MGTFKELKNDTEKSKVGGKWELEIVIPDLFMWSMNIFIVCRLCAMRGARGFMVSPASDSSAGQWGRQTWFDKSHKEIMKMVIGAMREVHLGDLV